MADEWVGAQNGVLPSFLSNICYCHQHKQKATRNTMSGRKIVLLLWIAAGISRSQFTLFQIQIDVNFQMEIVCLYFLRFLSAQHLSDVKAVRNDG